MWRKLHFILYPIFILRPHNFSTFPFILHLRQSTLPPLLIACMFHQVEHRLHCCCRSCTQYASFVGRSVAGDWRRSRRLETTVAVPLGVGQHCKFLITPYYPFFPTSPLSTISTLINSWNMFYPTSRSSALHPPVNIGTNSREDNWYKRRRVPVPSSIGRYHRNRTTAPERPPPPPLFL